MARIQFGPGFSRHERPREALQVLRFYYGMQKFEK